LNRLDNDEKAIQSLRSVYYLQLALTNYLQSYLTLLKSEFIIIDHQTIVDSVHRIRKNVNQLQRLIDEKIKMYSKEYSEAEINNLFKKYQPLNEKNVSQYVNDLYNLSRQCFPPKKEKKKMTEGCGSNKEKERMAEYVWLNREREKVNTEFNQFFLTLQKERKRLNEM
jgi:hypothetical protein